MTKREIWMQQAPLIKKYKQMPEKAIKVLSAQGVLGDNITCRIRRGTFFKEAGLHPASGGSGSHIWPGDMFLESLAACAGVTLNTVASVFGIKLRNSSVTAEGEVDFRGTLIESNEAPAGFKWLRLKFEIDTDADETQIKNLISLTERHCVVFQTLKQTPVIDIVLKDNRTINV